MKNGDIVSVYDEGVLVCVGRVIDVLKNVVRIRESQIGTVLCRVNQCQYADSAQRTKYECEELADEIFSRPDLP